MKNALAIKHLYKTYSNGVHALHDINFSVETGDFFGLLGPNGAGKSTTIGIITSLVSKTSGDIKIMGYDLQKQPRKTKRCIGLVPQEFNFNIFETTNQILINQAGYYGIPYKLAEKKARYYLERMDLWEQRDRAPRVLSGGMKRRLMIARALIHEPQLLILDEPTAGVDVELRHTLWDFLEEINHNGTTIILTTHYLEEAESLCKNIAIINRGKIIEHLPKAKLLNQLKQETFVLYLKNPLHSPLLGSPFQFETTDPHTLDVTIKNETNLNEIFQYLSEHQILVSSMKNKKNRLEELFLNLTGTNDGN
ncbi:MAG: ABC transporter [Gammaproteobacteria bacterium RIFCSPLOWO2_02_FULL_38_11]|nr:MAG: ABC transporter [Gammaproteobacteria bacterium RIFCSPHIGHO2_02_FULL_38_33]OGT67804.1 MAG: ABC transporter [Gammaproteobacteria bacterium RIFCSPLOWO2_02_FULL_38_11]OGT75780.1 MAG: ABC transporter [Gammaproteobacteria bacterium RIFCSPLOWO2_12_FULL_38_14]